MVKLDLGKRARWRTCCTTAELNRIGSSSLATTVTRFHILLLLSVFTALVQYPYRVARNCSSSSLLLAVEFLYQRECRKSVLDSLYRPPKPEAEEKMANGFRLVREGRFDMPPFAVDLLTEFRAVNDALLKRLNACLCHCQVLLTYATRIASTVLRIFSRNDQTLI